jgi:hypothetical protein
VYLQRKRHPDFAAPLAMPVCCGALATSGPPGPGPGLLGSGPDVMAVPFETPQASGGKAQVGIIDVKSSSPCNKTGLR